MACAERSFNPVSAVSSLISNVNRHSDGGLCIAFQD